MTPPYKVKRPLANNLDPRNKRPWVIILKKGDPNQNIMTPLRAARVVEKQFVKKKITTPLPSKMSLRVYRALLCPYFIDFQPGAYEIIKKVSIENW